MFVNSYNRKGEFHIDRIKRILYIGSSLKREGMRLYWELFFAFFKIGLFTFGGGYAMLPLVQREMMRHKWVTEKEIGDYYALAQLTPGIIAVNVSTFVGYKLKGWLGALCTMAGIVTPSLIIITILALLLDRTWANETMQHAFNGVQLMVPALILPIVVRMVSHRAQDWFGAFLMALSFGFVYIGVSPILILCLCGFVSMLWYLLRSPK